MPSSRAMFCAAVATCVLVGFAAPASAQTYPAQNITLLVAFAPGGAADLVARTVAQKLSDRLGQKVLVENRGGAAGNVAAKIVTGASPDGYTILVTTTALAVNDTAARNKGYNTDDLRPISIVASTPDALAVHPSNPAKTLKEFIANAKGRTISFGSAGVGTGPHIAATYFFKEIAKVEAVHIPFPGGAPAVAATMGNHVEMVATSLPAGIAQINEGALRGLGLASPARLASVPNVPTYGEAGFPDFYSSTWVGFFVPAKAQDAVVARLSTEINAIVSDKDTQERFRIIGFEPIVKSETEIVAYFKSEVATWGKMSKAIGFQLD